MNTLKSLLVVGVLATVSVSAPAFAVTWCGDNYVTGVNVNINGDLLASFDKVGASLVVCNLNADRNGWSPAACRGLHSNLMSAMLAGKRVELWFSAKTDCARIPDWADVTSSSYGFYHFRVNR